MNKITTLFSIQYPIIQGGMIWCSGWELAAAVSNGGGLGLIGSGSMTPEILHTHIRKCKNATDKPFGVNIPLLFPHTEEFIDILIKEKVNIVFTSAGNPAKWTAYLRENGIKVVHVIANAKFAIKAEEAGVDAVVAEGFEAGGHNAREETTTMVLIPLIKQTVSIPVIAAGGICNGKGMLAAMSLGADAVQIGSRFVCAAESSAHPVFKQKILDAKEGDTMLVLKKLIPVRLLKNKFFEKVQQYESRNASPDELIELIGKERAKKGMFEGDINEGELEIGQASALINQIKPAGEIIREIIEEFEHAVKNIAGTRF